jgi:sigma-B regulation protein RsbU (phosphoserine phosphatase)
MSPTAIDKVPCLYIEFNDRGSIVFANRMAHESLGYVALSLHGKQLEDILPVASKIFYQTHLFPLLSLTREANEIFIHLKKASGEQIPVLVNASRNTQEEPINSLAGIVVHSREKFEEELIRAKKTVEESLRENSALVAAQDELRRYAKELDASLHTTRLQNQELRQFNKIVTHDFQEPVRKLFYYTDALKEEIDNYSGDKHGSFAKLVSSAHQLRSMLAGLQEYAWITETQPVFSSQLLDPIVQDVILQLRKDYQTVEYDIEILPLPEVTGDREMLWKLFYFILDNAIRFSREGVRNHVKIHGLITMRNIFVASEHQYNYGEFVKIEIEDRGKGFDPALKMEAFDLFRKLHNSEGRGLGLALSKKIMQLHGGFIEADPQIDKGTRISLFFPSK